MDELEINLNLLSLSKNSKGLNYKFYIDLIQKNPFGDKF